MQFIRQFYFLSNDFPCMITYNGYVYRCATSAYLAQLAPITSRYKFEKLDAEKARKLARQYPTYNDWDTNKITHLREILKSKFSQNTDLYNQLMAIKNDIVYTNTIGDTTLGVCGGIGENILGKLLMETRDNFQKQVRATTLKINTVGILADTYSETSQYLDINEWMSVLQKLTPTIKTFAQIGAKNFISRGYAGGEQVAFWCIEDIKTDFPDVKSYIYQGCPDDVLIANNSDIFGEQDLTLMMRACNGLRISYPKHVQNMYDVRDSSILKDSDCLIVISPCSKSWKCNPSSNIDNILNTCSKHQIPVIGFDPNLKTPWFPTQFDFKFAREIFDVVTPKTYV